MKGVLVLALPGALLFSSPAGQFLLRSTVLNPQQLVDPVNLLGLESGSDEELAGLMLAMR